MDGERLLRPGHFVTDRKKISACPQAILSPTAKPIFSRTRGRPLSTNGVVMKCERCKEQIGKGRLSGPHERLVYAHYTPIDTPKYIEVIASFFYCRDCGNQWTWDAQSKVGRGWIDEGKSLVPDYPYWQAPPELQ
jgi:hypothetical protein